MAFCGKLFLQIDVSENGKILVFTNVPVRNINFLLTKHNHTSNFILQKK